MAGSAITPTVVSGLLVPTVLLAVAVFAYPRLPIGSFLPSVAPDKLAAGTIGVAATYLGALLALGVITFGIGDWIPLLAIGFGVLGAALAGRHPARATTEKLLAGGAGGLIAFAASNLVVALTDPTTTGAAPDHTLLAVLLAIPATGLLPLGHADATGSPYATPLRALIVVAPLGMVVLALTSDPVLSSGTRFTLVLYNTIFSGLVAILGVVPYWVGTGLVRRPPA